MRNCDRERLKRVLKDAKDSSRENDQERIDELESIIHKTVEMMSTKQRDELFFKLIVLDI
jgi:glycosylphosphatidylinositol transamidase (GPIT) subunit GPI8